MFFTKKISKILSFILILVFILSAFLLIKKEKKNTFTPPPPPPKELTENDLVLKNFKRSQLNNSKVMWEVVAQEAQIENKKDLLNLKKVNLKFFTKDKKEILIKSNLAKINTKKNEIKSALLNGNININVNDLILKTQKADFNIINGDQILESNEKVEIITKTMITTASKFKINLNTEIIELYGNVRTEIKK